MSALADESFTLNIPPRFNPQQETGEVRIVLALSAAPAGSQLLVNGTTTINLGSTSTVAGDSVTFEASVGNAARIVYKPLSNFTGDFCAGNVTMEKNIPLRFIGAQDIVSYRMSTYIVGAPSAECSKVSRRTNDLAASILPAGDGVAPDLDAVFKGRLHLDVVLVLDKSGSMAGLPPGSLMGASKAEILHSAATGFVAQWSAIDADTEGLDFAQDRIGVVFFDSVPSAQSITGGDAPASFFVQRGTGPPGAMHQWNAVVNNINTLTPGSATSVGGGINTAMSQWVADPDNDLYLLVVTDGIQNTAPLLAPTPAGFLGLAPVSGLDPELRKRFIPIQSIGFGTPSAVDADLLTRLALETSGVNFLSVNATTAFASFGQALVAILKGNTASLAIQRQDSLTGAGPSAPRSVLVDASAQRAVFSVQWAPPLRDAFELEVFRPDGTLATPTSTDKRPQIALQSFDLTRKDIGTWTVRVKRTKGSKIDEKPLPYNLDVFFLERDLDYRFAFDTVHARTGENIRLRATVAHDGKPLTKLPPNAIRARVLRPSEGLGNILRAMSGDAGGPAVPSTDALSPYHRKVANLGRRVLDRVSPREVATVSLVEEGKGVYSVVFDKTDIPGTYAFEVMLDWDHERTGRVHREERIEQIVRVKPDRAKTIIATRRSGTTMHITVTPRDRFGNYVGPGYASLVRARLKNGGKLRSDVPVDKNETGTYEFTVTDVRRGVMPDVEITVDGVPVGKR